MTPVPTYHVALLDDADALGGEVERLAGLGAQVLAASSAPLVEEGTGDLAAGVLIARWPGTVPEGAAGADARVVATFTGLGAEAAVPTWTPPQEHDARFPHPAYDLVCVDVHDVAGFLRYIGAPGTGADGNEPVVRAFGGATLAASAASPDGLCVLRSSWPEQRMMVVHRWPSGVAFRAFMDSPEYRPWLQLRRSCATSLHVVLEGLGG